MGGGGERNAAPRLVRWGGLEFGPAETVGWIDHVVNWRPAGRNHRPRQDPPVPSHLPVPEPLEPLGGVSVPGEGVWTPAGRPVGGLPAVYETTLVPPGGAQPAGIAWMDTRLLSAQLYSGSIEPGWWPVRASPPPIQPAQAASLVAAFNGGFKMDVAEGGYYTEGRTASTRSSPERRRS